MNISKISDTSILLQIALFDREVCQNLIRAFKKFYNKVYDEETYNKGESYYNIIFEEHGKKKWWYQAMRGNLRGIRYLDKKRIEGCTAKAIDIAAYYGHYEIVKYLHENRTEGCTTEAMDDAAKNGHLEIVRYLDEKGYKCTEDAMNWVASNGRLEVIKYLHEKGYKCTIHAIDWASRNGEYEVVRYLHEKGYGCTIYAMKFAVMREYKEMVKYLKDHNLDGRTDTVCEIEGCPGKGK